MQRKRQRKRAADRKTEIIETAIRLSADIGPDRVTTQHLADAVGVTQPAIFRHFATKADIWAAVSEHIAAGISALHHPTAEDEADDAHGALHRVVGDHLHHISRQPAIPAILFSRELQSDNAALKQTFASLLEERLATFAGLIRRAQTTGQHQAHLIAEDAAGLVLAALQGLSMRWLLEDRTFDLVSEGKRVVGGLIDSFQGENAAGAADS